MNKINVNRKGTIKVSGSLIRRDLETLLLVFRNLVVVHLENNFMTDLITYFAYSLKFRELNEGECTPEYQVIVKTLKNGQKRVSFKEVKP